MRPFLFGILLLLVACRRPSTQFSAMMTPVNQPDDYSRYLKARDELIALGNSPAWSLLINPSKGILQVKLPNGDSITTPVPEPQPIRVGDSSEGAFRYTAQIAGMDPISILFKPERCMDTLSGQRFDYRVEVAVRGKNYVGCGVSLRQLTLLQDSWVLTDFQGQAINVDESRRDVPRLDISLTEGRVTGTTGCNRLSGPVRADTHQIVFGPLITTRMACAGVVGEFESTFVNGLAGPLTYQVSEGKLIFLRNDKPLMVFKKVD